MSQPSDKPKQAAPWNPETEDFSTALMRQHEAMKHQPAPPAAPAAGVTAEQVKAKQIEAAQQVVDAIRDRVNELQLGLDECRLAAAPAAPLVDSNDDEITIKPCPFCGGEALMRDHEDGANYIECSKCQASTNLQYSEKCDARPLLIERWNRRAGAPRRGRGI